MFFTYYTRNLESRKAEHVSTILKRLFSLGDSRWTGRSLFALGFLQIYHKKRAQQRKFSANIFSEQLFRENICVKFSLLGSFVVINLKKPQKRKWSTFSSISFFKVYRLKVRSIFLASKTRQGR